MIRNRSEQDPPARIQRLDGEVAAARCQHQRRVDKTHVPACIAAGKLEARREPHAALRIEHLGKRGVARVVYPVQLFIDRRTAPDRADLALDADAALGLIAGALHESSSGYRSPRRSAVAVALKCE